MAHVRVVSHVLAHPRAHVHPCHACQITVRNYQFQTRLSIRHLQMHSSRPCHCTAAAKNRAMAAQPLLPQDDRVALSVGLKTTPWYQSPCTRSIWIVAETRSSTLLTISSSLPTQCKPNFLWLYLRLTNPWLPMWVRSSGLHDMRS